ncbi:extracellular solute-binding protein [Paenibacillus sp. J5C_2022]|uniref:extracellular solute-binding protein n=1 Tax=Paenibacillus sp. J5C2022 TaxID=2977129 RepID=UPI0021D2EB62|nr:extracellular solute-binding protein [Paenibacillus sp. J5C2022]MCU6711448.1 extracellular solute-binding protein [Paenibacillus sp. J5C2022]
MVKYRKASSMLLCFVMIIAMLAACGSPNDEKKDSEASKPPASEAPKGDDKEGESGEAGGVSKEGFPIVKEAVTLTMMAPDVGVADWKEMPVLQEMEKLTGIKLEFRNAPQDSFETKKNLVYASGDLPDILFAADIKPAEQVTYGSQGILLPLDKYIDEGYAPNLKKIFDEHPEIRQSFTTPDGHMYALPNINLSAVWYRGPVWYNGTFLKAMGQTELPKTTEELYDYLKRVKESDPNGNGKADEIPLTSVKLDDLRMYFLGFWGIYNEKVYADKENKVHYTPQEEGYKGYLTFLNRLWKEELLDHETFSQTNEQKKAKGKNQQLALFSDYFPYFTLDEEPSQNNPLMTPVASEIAGTPVYGKHPGISANGTFAITSSNPNPEATMRWVDYMYSYEGATLFGQGPEGLLWQYKDKEKKEKEWLPVPDGSEREEYRGKLTPNYGILTPGMHSNDVNIGLRSEFDLWIDKENEEKLVPISKPPMRNVYLNNEEQTEASTLLSDLDTYVKQMEAKFVTGQEPLENWDKYVAQLKKMGSDRIVELYQSAVDR